MSGAGGFLVLGGSPGGGAPRGVGLAGVECCEDALVADGDQAGDPQGERAAVDHADRLIAELTEAYRKNTWAHRAEARGPEMTAWLRAAAFLDGSIFCGSVPRER